MSHAGESDDLLTFVSRLQKRLQTARELSSSETVKLLAEAQRLLSVYADAAPLESSARASADPRVAEIVGFIWQQYRLPTLDIAQAAAFVRLSRWHAARLLHRHTGQTFRGLLLQVRMSEARRHLDERRLTVKEVAALVGYSSVAAFSRQFKRSCGRSPRDWRRS